jgi:hypothetical protein
MKKNAKSALYSKANELRNSNFTISKNVSAETERIKTKIENSIGLTFLSNEKNFKLLWLEGVEGEFFLFI